MWSDCTKIALWEKIFENKQFVVICQTSCCPNLMAIKQIPLSYNSSKVIPLKLFYYQTFLETWHNELS